MSFIFTSQIKICQQRHCWIEDIEKETIPQEFGLSVVEKVSVPSQCMQKFTTNEREHYDTT